jgi:hypothetical protein
VFIDLVKNEVRLKGVEGPKTALQFIHWLVMVFLNASSEE